MTSVLRFLKISITFHKFVFHFHPTMARILQAFQLNPSLGGFGNETGLSIQEGDCDAFAQIVKELVDNAVDACRQDSENRIHRVRVEFHQISANILRVTVTDNGCGMACIQDCVEAFRSSKQPNNSSNEKTAGRYGIGLTLCLLHAQRLVPNSTASITSATKSSNSFQRAEYVVDTKDDCIKCIQNEDILKSRPDESGTSISILVPVSN
jgi:DNA topoisomerase VI subunit B